MNHRLISILVMLLVSISTVSAASVMPYKCDGTADNQFDEGDDLCVYGVGFNPGSQVDVVVVADQDDYNEGDLLSPVAKETVTTTSSGLIALTKVWQSVVSGLYDIIVDIARNGFWNSGDAVNIGSGAGVAVSGGEGPSQPDEVPEFTTLGALLVLIGAGFIISRKRRQK